MLKRLEIRKLGQQPFNEEYQGMNENAQPVAQERHGIKQS